MYHSIFLQATHKLIQKLIIKCHFYQDIKCQFIAFSALTLLVAHQEEHLA